jgi:hypothetical protein
MSMQKSLSQSMGDQVERIATATQNPQDIGDEISNDYDDDASSFVSETSTVKYDQEPYASFQEKVVALSNSLFSDNTVNDIKLERIKGGSFNRIIGITLLKSKLPLFLMGQFRAMLSVCIRGKTKQTPKPKDLILRVPRDTLHNLFYQAITLSYLERKLPYPVPKPVCYDSGTENALGRAYMVQKRLPGQSLSQLWPKLNLQQRKGAARCIAEIVRDLHKVKNSCAGIISPLNTTHDLNVDLMKIEPMPISGVVSLTNSPFNAKLASPQITRDLLLSLVSRQRAHGEATGLPPFDDIWTSFISMINKLHDLGALPDKDTFHFYHADLQSRNLLFTTPTPSSVCLTGILDWDSALFAPKFMSTRAPFFLWTDEWAGESAEGDALLESDDAEMCGYKRIFEEVVGEKFCKDAYRPEYIFARRLWKFLIGGIRSGGDEFMAELLVEEWEEMYGPTVP